MRILFTKARKFLLMLLGVTVTTVFTAVINTNQEEVEDSNFTLIPTAHADHPGSISSGGGGGGGGGSCSGGGSGGGATSGGGRNSSGCSAANSSSSIGGT